MIDILKENLSWIIPIVLPIGFFLVGLFVKFTMGQKDFHFFGGDLAFVGCAIFSSTALRQIFLQKLTDSSEIVLAFLEIAASLVIWYLCLILGRPKIIWRSVAAFCVATASFYLCAFLSWRIIDIGNK